MDYNSTDGGGSGESKFKECPWCEGVGKIPECDDHQENVNFIPCDTCHGTGQIEMTADEIEMEEDANRDDEADKRE